ncbi:PAS domain-containing sensor histidine kinase [Flavisolibacter tropicus]|uniref:histidine kinase n=1 Tax=Flavisolibacter tropicus TaxID=1492898 RepID=A0A172TVG0_9BACT|nr:PAS domain S-box protein [Flavisolibacter tropicus]ANE50727.1 hypothetical protein SY85_09675 [Flavisolibacter tropicus]
MFYLLNVLRLYSECLLTFATAMNSRYSASNSYDQAHLPKFGQEQLEKLLHSLVDVVCTIDVQGNFRYVSEASLQLWGYTPEEMINTSFLTFLAPEDIEKTIQAADEIKSTYVITNFQNRYIHKDGSIIPVSWSVKWNEKDHLLYCVARDASEKTEANFRELKKNEKTEAQLAISEQKFKSLVQNGSDIIVIIDEAGTFKYVSENVRTILGFEPDMFLNKNAFDYIHANDKGDVFSELAKVIQNNPDAIGIAHRFLKSDGDWLWLESKGINHLNNSFVNGIVINSRDITDRMRLQKQLEDEQLKKQREITAAVIKAQEEERSQIGLELHDNVNQILTTVKLYNEMFLSGYREDRELLKKSNYFLQDCINEIRSISKRLSAPTLGNISLQDSIKEAVESINLTNRFKIQYQTYNLENANVNQDLHLAVYRIVQEALNNIIKYADAKEVIIDIKNHNRKLCISIIDDGKGFDLTKKPKGIGLTNMKTRADNLKGSFKIKTSKGNGCAIDVCFPM